MDTALLKLYAELDRLFVGIERLCFGCRDRECEGYVWLLPEEADILYEQGVPVLVVNDESSFIHSVPEQDGEVVISAKSPSTCILRREGKCSMHASRPLCCRMYPIGLETVGSDIVFALHRDCAFSRSLVGASRDAFVEQFHEILEKTERGLLSRIIEVYGAVDSIYIFLDGPNAFDVITAPMNEYLRR